MAKPTRQTPPRPWLSIGVLPLLWTSHCAGPAAERKTVATGAAPQPADTRGDGFDLAQATRGLPGEGELAAELHTSMGRIDCELWSDEAPITVANFVGLARGLRAWKRNGTWVELPFFDGTTFHRVVPGFVIQAGARLHEEIGNAGYTIPDEVWEGAAHDRAGLLCMANDGPDSGSSQFFILATSEASQLDGSYTIFGSCFQTDIVDEISRVKAYGERPATPVTLDRVVIKLEPRW